MQHLPTQFEDHAIRRVYDENSEIWWFSVVDIIQVLTQQSDYQAARNYWKVLKSRLAKEGSESVTKCNRLKLTAADGKNYLTDVATGMVENETAAKTGGQLASRARLELESRTGRKVVSGENFLPPQHKSLKKK